MDYVTRFYEGWRDLMDNKSDPRTTDWFLMSSPFPTIIISLSYAYFVKVRTRQLTNKSYNIMTLFSLMDILKPLFLPLHISQSGKWISPSIAKKN